VPRAVDIIIPIYGAADELRDCIASVAAHTDLDTHRVILVIDGPQALPDLPPWTILRNERRLGFAASVNRGMRESARDVVLLNSDTIVTPRWVEKLIDAAYSDDHIGTVTPLSNNATLCSVPRAFEENLIPDIASFAERVERVSMRSYPRIPTGVGFCLYIKRALLEDIGLFDASRFADGYGEENDFCLRAHDRGWLHIADDATFIYHAGHRSFGASHTERQRRAKAKLPRRYMTMIAELMKRDPLAEVRGRIRAAPMADGRWQMAEDAGCAVAQSRGDVALSNRVTEQPRNSHRPPSAIRHLPSAQLRVTHLVHGWPPFQHAGTELYAYWLVQRQREKYDVSVYARGADPARGEREAVELDDGGARVRIVTNHFTARDPLRRNAIRDRALERDFERFLRDERPRLLHVHHLAGHAFSLVHVAKRLGIPIVMQLQDWWFVCARVNRFDRDGRRCDGPSPAKCARCVTLTRIPAMNGVMHALRRRAARAALATADVFIAGTNAIRDDYAGVVPRATPFHVIPYGVAIDAQRRRVSARRPIRFGYVGSDAPHKGLQVAVEAMRGIDPLDAVLEVRRGFAEDEKPRVFAEMDVLIVPSIGLESFGLVAHEAMACGVPVIASAGSASESFPAGDATALRAIIERVIETPSIVDEWSARLPEAKRVDVHAEEIERVYRSVLR
jgi:GT2 family glycosyltransferase/glycosyltransferase involved in cell wall biosynthesis